MSLLQVDAVSRSYGEVRAVSGASLAIEAGARTAIVGPSGSGKTTLLRLIAGFEQADSGTITLDGHDITREPAHRRGIGYVTQEGALFPHLTVAENVGFGLPRTADRRGGIAGLMMAVGLPEAMGRRKPHELSGGQQQRVALARALAMKPRLMLLDEPFSALDAGLREATREMVGDVLRAAGVTPILVTHDQTEALSFADQLIVMREGQVVQAGPPQEVYLRPRDAVTARFLGDAIIIEAELRDGFALCGLGAVPVTDGRQGRAHIMLRPEQIALSAGGEGRVTARQFRGPICRLTVALAIGNITLNLPAIAVPETDARVRVTVVGTAHVL